MLLGLYFGFLDQNLANHLKLLLQGIAHCAIHRKVRLATPMSGDAFSQGQWNVIASLESGNECMPKLETSKVEWTFDFFNLS